MLTVVTPAAATNLTTPARVQAMLGSGAGVDSATLATLIAQASRAIVDHCRRPFGLEQVRERWDVLPLRCGILLARSPVVTIDAVVDDGVTLASTGYSYDPETGMLYRTPEAGGGAWLWWAGSLSVTYAAGYVLPSDVSGAPASTLPPPVERAAIALVAAYLSIRGRDPLAKSETIEGIGGTTWYVPGATSVLADPEAQQLLEPYRRLF